MSDEDDEFAESFGAGRRTNQWAPVGWSKDLERVLSLPRRPSLLSGSPTEEALVEYEMAKWARPRGTPCRCAAIDPQRARGAAEAGVSPCIERLLPIQAHMLYEIAVVGGLVGAVPVGGGKTAVNLLAPLALRAWAERNGEKLNTILLLVPPSLLTQLETDYELIAEHFRVPSVIYYGSDRTRSRAQPGEPTLHVLPYSRLSQPDSSDWIRQLAPDAIIADEGDSLHDVTSARGGRVARAFRESPRTRFCTWTGSLTDKSLTEFWHLLAWALRLRSPLPLDEIVVEEWDVAVGASGNESCAGELARLCAPGESVRRAFHRRLAETPGVICAPPTDVVVSGGDVPVRVEVRERVAPSLPPKIQEALRKVREEYVRPDSLVALPTDDVEPQDEELEDALTQARTAREVASGVFYRWTFPPINGVPQKREDVLRWYAARRMWHRAVRAQVVNNEEYLDSPILCERAAMRAWGDAPPIDGRPSWPEPAWPVWRDVRDTVVPKPEAVWLDEYLARDAARWGQENRGIIWYGMREFAVRVASLSGLPLHAGGPHAGRLLKQEDGSRSIIASIKSHGRGRDGLQHLFGEQLVAQAPASATGWEQLLGRLVRRGQRRDLVRTWVYVHTTELRDAVAQAIARGEYVESLLGQRQKLNAGWR